MGPAPLPGQGNSIHNPLANHIWICSPLEVDALFLGEVCRPAERNIFHFAEFCTAKPVYSALQDSPAKAPNKLMCCRCQPAALIYTTYLVDCVGRLRMGCRCPFADVTFTNPLSCHNRVSLKSSQPARRRNIKPWLPLALQALSM